MTNRRLERTEAEWKDFESTNEDRIKAQEQQFNDQDIITISYPSREEQAAALEEDLFLFRQLREQYRNRI